MLNRTSPYHPLKTCLLGSFYTCDYFDNITEPQVRSALQKISDEINHDLETFAAIMRRDGVQVLRAALPDKHRFAESVIQGEPLLPPLQVRNDHVVLYDKIYQLSASSLSISPEIDQTIIDVSDVNQRLYQESVLANHKAQDHNGQWYRQQHYQELSGPDWPSFENFVQGDRGSDTHIQTELAELESGLIYDTRDFGALAAPNLIPLPDRMIVDCNEYYPLHRMLHDHLQLQMPLIELHTGAGHLDGCMSVLGQQVILAAENLLDYARYFPDYRVISIDAESYMDQVQFFAAQSPDIKGRWWVADQHDNQRFVAYVNKYLTQWTGYVAESLFDVNVLSAAPDYIYISSDKTSLRQQLDKMGINTTVVPWRHRFFVDGGLHCITLDLERT